jgi:UDP-N-acetylmuramoylalanine--D-glutamate ligase
MVAASREDQWNVLELSSFQTESIEHFRAAIAVCLNVTPDHLDRYATFGDYVAAKRRLFEVLDEGSFAVLNADDEHCVSFAKATRAQVMWFSVRKRVEPGIWVENSEIRYQGEPAMKTEDIPLRGKHNWENVLAAATVARLSGASLSQLAAAVRSFEGVEHRIEFVRRVGGVGFYNDSKATNVDAALKSIDSFGERLFVILGGKDKGSDYSPLAAPLKHKAVAALLIGQAARTIEAAIHESVPVVCCATLEAAVETAYAQARAGDVVLLAPACASFDQFDNYEHRGRAFKQAVASLSEKEPRV